MQQNRVEFIKNKIETLRRMEAKLVSDLEELRAELDVYKIAMSEILSGLASNEGKGEVPAKKRIARYIKPDTIMQNVINVLEGSDGMIALDILARLNERRERPLARTSLSPQLSRLKAANIIELNGNEWRLVADKTTKNR